MEPVLKGRHCEVCAHEVIDFTQWELQDIAKYLEARKGQRTCGRFLTKQLNQPFDLAVFTPNIIQWQTNSFRKIAALIIVCFAIATTSCGNNNHTQGEAAQNKKEIEKQKYLTGVTIPLDVIPEMDSVTQAKSTTKARHKKVKAEEGIALGYETTMGVPEMEYPKEWPPADTIAPKFQPPIGPPEEDVKLKDKSE